MDLPKYQKFYGCENTAAKALMQCDERLGQLEAWSWLCLGFINVTDNRTRLGDEHIKTVTTTGPLARIHTRLRRVDEALVLYKQLFATAKKKKNSMLTKIQLYSLWAWLITGLKSLGCLAEKALKRQQPSH